MQNNTNCLSFSTKRNSSIKKPISLPMKKKNKGLAGKQDCTRKLLATKFYPQPLVVSLLCATYAISLSACFGPYPGKNFATLCISTYTTAFSRLAHFLLITLRQLISDPLSMLVRLPSDNVEILSFKGLHSICRHQKYTLPVVLRAKKCLR